MDHERSSEGRAEHSVQVRAVGALEVGYSRLDLTASIEPYCFGESDLRNLQEGAIKGRGNIQ
jgi:hypothetical protein